MSTEHQEYSTDNQSDVIRAYAAVRDFEIVRTYADEGKSGLRLKGRPGLKRLIADVESGQADFEVILVYDVSRWGRFQNPDEGAHYEFVCRHAGIPVHYCAEQFINDGSPISDIIKNLKRSMAAEYSRELSAKVFKGQCRLIELGFRQGGQPGFGLRRLLLDQSREPKGELSKGERKSLQTDRVVLMLGPEEELATVRRIYRLFVTDGWGEGDIADLLNSEGLRTDLDRPWTRGTVHQVLINEKYIGNNVWNRISSSLKRKHVRNPPDLWVRAEGVFPAVIERGTFDAAQAIIQARSFRLTDSEMLAILRELLNKRGFLSGIIIDETDGCPSSSAFQNRFGSLLEAYKLIGFTPDRDYRYIEINRALRRMYPGIVANTIAGIEAMGGWVRRDPVSDLITINGEFTASIVVVRCRETQAGSLRWQIRLDRGLNPDITVAVRMDSINETPLDYYILPTRDMTEERLRLAEHNGLSLDTYRFETLDQLFEMAGRVSIMEVHYGRAA